METVIKRTKKRSFGIFDILNVIIMLVLIVVTVYPFYFTLMCSLSDPQRLLAHQGGLLLPLEPFTLKGYKLVLDNKSILTGLTNTAVYVVLGTVISLVLTAIGAFVLSRKHFYLKKIIMAGILITMFFGGGIIPLFFVVKSLGIYNTGLAMILPWAISTFNLIIMRTFFMEIPPEMEESAYIDGATDLQVFINIFIPLSVPVIAVIILYYGVGYWNSWYPALIFIRDRNLYPLQMFLREVLILNKNMSEGGAAVNISESYTRELVKYCVAIVSTVPIMILYPFLQKYFVKGVMIGAIKG